MMRHSRHAEISRLQREDGVALLVALMAMLLLSALGLAVTMTTMTEIKIAGNYRGGSEAMYAADAAVERVMQDILTVPNWNQILDGTLTSSFVDGPPFGIRDTGAGRINLIEATNMARCGKATLCSDGDIIDPENPDRPWGANNPRWQLYAYGRMSEMIPTNTINSSMYVIVWVADDPAENDNNPFRDGDPRAGCALPQCDPARPENRNPGAGVLAMLAHAYGPDGVRRVIEVTVARTDSTEIERGYTGQRGQDEQNRRARKAAVQTPGKALTNRTLNLSNAINGFQGS